MYYQKNQLFQVLLIILFAILCEGTLSVTRADEAPAWGPELESQLVEEKSTWKAIQERVRIRSFTEFMTPAFNNQKNYVPTPENGTLMPSNAYSMSWIDYEFAQDFKILYWQRYWINFADTDANRAVNVVMRNPRFALRKVNVFKVPNLNTTYDLYVQPGLAPEAATAGRDFEFGLRTNTSYTFPSSRWTIGLITEGQYAVSNTNMSTGASFYGWGTGWGSYTLTKMFSTQHYATINFQHNRGTTGLQWDTPMPYIQNGISASVTPNIWVAAFLNNYLTDAPTLSNTWASLWLNLTVL